MKRTLYVCLLLPLWADAARAQSSNGYVFFGPGAMTYTGFSHSARAFYYGGGGEGILGKIVGLGAELGAVSNMQFRGILGLADVNGYAHFYPRRRPRFDPFFTGGYTLLFREGHANLFNLGGGANYWFSRRLGLRLEFRDHVWRQSGTTAHLWGFRGGLSFRGGGD